MERIAEEYGSHNVDELLLPHPMGRGFFFYPEKRELKGDRSYDSNADFWQDAFRDQVIAERTVLLRGFNIFEWIPRNPGLYHKREAADAREMAQQFIQYGSPTGYVGGAAQSLDHAAVFRSITQAKGSTRQIIYTPQGKVSMLQGGVGCVRLSPVELKGKTGQFWFMSATSSEAPDEGIPVLMADDVYQTVIDEIRTYGSATRDLVGRTKFVPKEFRDLYSVRHGLPRLYLEVLETPRSEKRVTAPAQGEVSVAASFLSEYEGYPRIYASYVTFNPSSEGARQSATEWMKQEYIEGLYKGSVLTDFDQQAPSIADTLFSLNQVLTSPDLAKQIAVLKAKYGYFDWEMLEKSTLSFHTHEEKVMVNVSGQGNIVNIAKYMTDVSNTVNMNVGQSGASDEVKNLMNILAKQVADAGVKVEPAVAQKMGKNLEALSKELNSAAPEREWYEVSLDGLKKAAVAVGEVGVPILSTVAKLLPLLTPH